MIPTNIKSTSLSQPGDSAVFSRLVKAVCTHFSSLALSSSLTASVLHSTSPEGGPYLIAKGIATRRVALTSLPKGLHMMEGSLLPPCQRGSSPLHCIEPSHLALQACYHSFTRAGGSILL